jgi:hypothetical protein
MGLDCVEFVVATKAASATPQVTALAYRTQEVPGKVDHARSARQVRGLAGRRGLSSRGSRA